MPRRVHTPTPLQHVPQPHSSTTSPAEEEEGEEEEEEEEEEKEEEEEEEEDEEGGALWPRWHGAPHDLLLVTLSKRWDW